MLVIWTDYLVLASYTHPNTTLQEFLHCELFATWWNADIMVKKENKLPYP